MQQEDGTGDVETQVPMQVHKHCNVFTSFTDLLIVCPHCSTATYLKTSQYCPISIFSLDLQGPSEIDDMSVQDLL